MARKIFLLSPANLGGRRAAILTNPAAGFELAQKLRTQGAPLADVFSFISGLYFRGKIVYSRAFDTSTPSLASTWIITSDRGLTAVTATVSIDDLRSMSTASIDLNNDAYLASLKRDAVRLAGEMEEEDRVILLGSVASSKYVDPLLEVFSDKLHFPSAFVGRGDMSRGGLMLRSAQAAEELAYIPVCSAVRRGKRPPRLPKLPR